MPLITEYESVMKIYQDAAKLGIAIPAFSVEDRETLEAVLAAALEMGDKIGVDNIPIIPSLTSRYIRRPQATLITACRNPLIGMQLMFSDLSVFMDKTSPYHKLLVIPHLDHAIPWLDGDILETFVDSFASIMYDASEKPIEENIRLTSEFVQKVQGRVLIEGAINEIRESGGCGHEDKITTVKQAREFLKETGVDIIVPNVGTEHRATTKKVKYNYKRAREISATVGKILCIHGTSSIRQEELYKLPKDGFVKVNIYTTIAVSGGQAVARKVLRNLGNIFSKRQLQDLVKQGVLGKVVLSLDYGENKSPIKPKLEYVANATRRDAWFEAVKNKCKDYLELFNYRKYKEIKN